MVNLRCSALVLRHRQLYLNAVDAVDTVNEQDEDEDKRNLLHKLEILLPIAGEPRIYLHPIL